MTRKVRPAVLSNYKDEGCELQPSCLACALPRCQYDIVLPARKALHPDALTRRPSYPNN
jgi:hypothetical protein